MRNVVYECAACGDDVTAQAFRKATKGWIGREPRRPYSVEVIVICSRGHYLEAQVDVPAEDALKDHSDRLRDSQLARWFRDRR